MGRQRDEYEVGHLVVLAGGLSVALLLPIGLYIPNSPRRYWLRNSGMHFTKPKARRWFRFSLRSMLVLVTLSCCWLSWEIKAVRDRREARIQILAANDVAFFHGEMEGVEIVRYGHRRKPTWIRSLLGDEMVYSISFSRPPTAEDLKQIEYFPEAVVYAMKE